MSVVSVLREAAYVYRRLFRRSVATAAVVFVFLGLVDALPRSSGGGSALALAFVSWLVSTIGFFWVQGALVEVVQELRGGRTDVRIEELYRRTRSRLPSLVVGSLLAAVGVALAALLLVIPGLVLLTRWSLLVPVVVLERLPWKQALARSSALVKGHSWSVFAIVLVTFALGTVAGLLANRLFAPLPDLWQAWASGVLAQSLMVPFEAHALSVVYYRLSTPAQPEEPPRGRRWESIWAEQERLAGRAPG